MFNKGLIVFFLLVASAGITTSGFSQSDICTDYSPHTIRMLEVEPDVTLEVLDWGGDGEVIVFLSGLGDTGHVFDYFALHFTPYYRVLSITRRGIGNSSWPEENYDSDTRVNDIISVLDKLDIQSATFIGHSVAGDELSKLGAAFPERITKMIYLDAYNYEGGRALAKIINENPIPQSPSIAAESDSLSLLHLQASRVRQGTVRLAFSEICQKSNFDDSGRYLGANTSPENAMSIRLGTHDAEFEKIAVPVLGIFNIDIIDPTTLVSDYTDRSKEVRDQVDRTLNAELAWRNDQIDQFRNAIPSSRVIELTNSNHYVFISDERRVVNEIKSFLKE